MIPARLTLRNFLSYGDACPPLELEGIGLACLCGDNGHGKSSLIDAITWALWGRARGRDLDALVHHGRRNAEVDFEFIVGEARYRVVRRRQRIGARGVGRPSLEFQMRAEGEWRALTEPSIAQTEQAIERTLKLSYETFVNSALLLQGRSDLFTAAGPANRKRVLAEILDLGRYDGYEAIARSERKARADEAAEIERVLIELAPRLGRLPAMEAERAAARAELEEVAGALEGAEAELRGLVAAQFALEQQRAGLRAAEEEHARGAESLRAAEREQAELDAILAADDPMAAAAPAIGAGFQRLQRARDTEQSWSDKQRRAQAVDADLQLAQHRIASAEAQLKEQLSLLHGRRRAAAADGAEQAALALRQHELDAAAEALGVQDAEVAELLRRERLERDRCARLRSDLDHLDGVEVAANAQLDAVHATGARCPLCRSALDEEGIRSIEQSAGASRSHVEGLRQAAVEVIVAAEQESGRLRRLAERRGEELQRRRDAIARDRAGVDLRLDAARRAESLIGEIDAELHDLQGRLDRGETAAEVRATLRRLREEQTAIGYSAAKHREASRRVEEHRQYESRHQAMIEALARIAANRPARDRQKALAEVARLRLAQTEARLLALRAAVVQQPDLGDRLHVLESRLAALRDRRTALDQQQGRVEAQIAECHELRRLEQSKRERLARVRSEEVIYADLTTAFGRNGVQAFLIDAVLPEVEAEANRLLARMSDGRMTVRLETQRETRTGDLAETLDIVIADEWGARDYEMYSGGEAFRINLALRIALSKLLARRAGAPLPTLVIDEGFGSQDATGRERLMEAITAIQDDFHCLLLVTHLDEIRQLFDTRIDVTKDERGSVARVVRV